jgi:UDP-N-acetylmuramyl tripeptide synthase
MARRDSELDRAVVPCSAVPASGFSPPAFRFSPPASGFDYAARVNLRASAAIAAGKLAARASRLLGRGGGTAIAGLIAERVDPRIVRRLVSQAGAGAIAVTGTNGKTTTSLMLNRIAAEAGLRPLHNWSGSNLMRGVAAMLIDEATLGARMPDAARRLAILEVDEATLPQLMREVALTAVVFTNLFRDQLDRYGEVDTVAQTWSRALAQPASLAPMLVLNADDPAVAYLGREAARVLYYGIDDASAGGDAVEHASDFRTCLQCGAELRYAVTFYGHVGHWRCPACGNARPQPSVRIVSVAPCREGMSVTGVAGEDEFVVRLPLDGTYNSYNALASIAGAQALGLPRDAVVRALEGFSAAFGRQERFRVDGRDVHVLLGKNPTGLNQVLRTLAARDEPLRLLFFLNDGVADGRDVSWIWDTDYELIRPYCEWVLAAGTRAADLALRLKYAGFGDDVPAQTRTAWALKTAIEATPRGRRLYVLPTYTAMLEVRELLAKRAGVASYWERER